eukprot:3093557-Rhodomonas_salina.1
MSACANDAPATSNSCCTCTATATSSDSSSTPRLRTCVRPTLASGEAWERACASWRISDTRDWRISDTRDIPIMRHPHHPRPSDPPSNSSNIPDQPHAIRPYHTLNPRYAS